MHSVNTVSRFRSDIQGLRAIAVVAVVLYHAGIPFLPGGYVGVDVFFVVSGFLITTHLLTELGSSGKVRFASFYAKRARRILPASFLVLALSVLAALIWFPPLLMKEVWRGAVATALYVPNLLFAVNGTNYLAESTPSLFQHYWSLGIEEQFYLIWPLLLALGWRFVRSRRTLFMLLVVLVLMSFAAGVALTFLRQPYAFFLLPTRAWELGVGGIVAFLLVRRPQVVAARYAPALGWAGVAAILVPVFAFTASTPFPGYWAAIPVIGTALIILAGATPGNYSPTRLLSTRGMLFLGAISYSLYLVHWPALIVPQVAAGYADPLPLWVTLSIASVCVPLAWLMYRYVENPARKATYLAVPRRALFGALAGSLASIAIATSAFAYADARPLHTNENAPEVTAVSPPEPTAFVPANLKPALSDAADDQPIIYEDGCHLSFSSTALQPCLYGVEGGPRIVLFGDSHAAQWFPALVTFAEENGYAVENRTKSACPALSSPVLRAGVPYNECEEWQDAVLAEISDNPPELVLISNYGHQTIADNEDPEQAWELGLRRTLDRIDTTTVVIADTPRLMATPSVCLSANLRETSKCGASRTVALDSPARKIEPAVVAAAGARYLDFTDYICGELTCEPILGSSLVYRDQHHITATFSALLAPVLGQQLAGIIQ